jgi:hypothetical protein
MSCTPRADIVTHIQQCIQQHKKIRPEGSNFGVSLYHNILYSDKDVFRLSLKDYEFTPYMEGDNIICHPNTTLATLFTVAARSQRMIYGTPFYYPISIGGIIFNGGVGGHVESTNAASHVVKLLVVDGNGIDRIIEGDELKYFLCTFGYLGIAYKICLKTYPQKYLLVNKIPSTKPFNNKTHVTQMIFARVVRDNSGKIIPLLGNEAKPTYIDITMTPVENPHSNSLLSLKMQNIGKTLNFLVDGIISTFHSAAMSSFMNIFIPYNGSVVNSKGLVDAYPIIPRLVLEHIPLNLECGIYVDVSKLDDMLVIIEKYYRKYFYLNYDCINIVIRKILTNDVCMFDATNKDGGSDEVVLIDFGFFNGERHKNIIDEEIKELLPLAYGFHLGKYVNDDILEFMRKKFNGQMKSIKAKYDPNGVFSTQKLDQLFS